jgi:hypothetical protein
MKYHKLIFVLLLLLTSCIAVDKLQYSDSSFSTVTYVKNTLDYPVHVQCYFRPFNDNPFWCENELIAYSEPIEIQPNESKIVMDYIIPSGIKIFRGSDNSLLFENFELNDGGHKRLPQGTLTYSADEAKKIGTFTSKQIVPKTWSRVLVKYNSGYYIQDERYLCENVPWSLYPIHFEFYNCYKNLLEGDESRKSCYKELTDGYAFVNCIVFDKNASCFTP